MWRYQTLYSRPIGKLKFSRMEVTGRTLWLSVSQSQFWLCEFLRALGLRWEFFPFVLVVIPQIWTPPEPSGIQVLLLISKGCELSRGLRWWNQSGSSERRGWGGERNRIWSLKPSAGERNNLKEKSQKWLLSFLTIQWFFTFFRSELKWRGSHDYKYGHKEMAGRTWQSYSLNDTVS